MSLYRIDIDNKDDTTKYQNISTDKCFNKYNDQYVSKDGNVSLIQDTVYWRNLSLWYPEFDNSENSKGNFTWIKLDTDFNNDTANRLRNFRNINIFYDSYANEFPSNGWRCASRKVDPCDINNEFEVPKDRTKWSPYGNLVRYCMVEQVEELCRLQFSLPIAIAVITANFIKLVCIDLTLVKYKKHAALVTLGDAIASFLEHPDPKTVGRCLYSRRLMEAEWNSNHHTKSFKRRVKIEPKPFLPRRERWGKAPSNGRWLATYVLYVAAIISGFVFIAKSLNGMPRDPVKL